MTATHTSSTPLVWDDALLLDWQAMDDDHQGIVALLAAVVRADDAHLMPAWSALITAMQTHFDEEDRWMLESGFTENNCHSAQHHTILDIVREGEVRGHAGEHDVVRLMAQELGVWFPHHIDAMDAVLVTHLRAVTPA